MPSIPCVLIVLLICPSLDHMGVQGNSTVFSSVGGSATLPCSNVVYPNCSSTTWLISTYPPIEVVKLGQMNTDEVAHNPERLHLLSNCSLHIADVTTEDAGLYLCRQYLREGGEQHGSDAPVDLIVLDVLASPGETEMDKGSHVNLSCVVHPFSWCKDPQNEKTVYLSWIDEGGTELRCSRHERKRCTLKLDAAVSDGNSTLSQSQRTWRCQLTAGEQLKASATHTIRLKAPTGGGLMVGVGVCVCLLAAALISVVVIRKRRANAGGDDHHRASQSRGDFSLVQSAPPLNSSVKREQEPELHYAAFQHLNPTQAGPAAKQPDDTVTYSSVMQRSGGEDQSNSRPVDPSAVYATVQKNNNAHN
ncbi:hypothetical protein ACEWY4_021872 [Coilia grayii]|uniref:Ig-like domain-containing protein n=1 Tax=Coilia grayii TaxID=363190 RepID=A0ABD1J4E8_9TELE